MRERRPRRPRWVFGQGEEPDYSSSLANERTFLAWIRTALALLAAGVALDVVRLSISSRVQDAIAMALIGFALATSLVAWLRWGLSERAMRRGDPLPAFEFASLLVLVLAGICVVLVLTRL